MGKDLGNVGGTGPLGAGKSAKSAKAAAALKKIAAAAKKAKGEKKPAAQKNAKAPAKAATKATERAKLKITMANPESGVEAKLNKPGKDPKAIVGGNLQEILAPKLGKLEFAKGCGCMGMPQDPKTSVLGAVSDLGRMGNLDKLAKGCGCMGMAQDPKTSVLGDLGNRFDL